VTRFLDRLLAIAAALVLGGVLVTALHDVSQAWDSGYYHLPFAARLAGILPPDAFVFHPANAARFAGFPLLGERVQGLLWRLTGRPEAANLLALGSLPLLAWFSKRRFAVPPHLTVLSLLAVPLVQTHASSAYVDLPANAALAVVVLLAIGAFASPEPVSLGTLGIGAAAAAVAANMKALSHPVALLAFGALAIRYLASRRSAGSVAVIALCLPVIFATPLANLVAHGNPYYPVRMSLLGHALPGIEAAYASSPPWLADSPRPVRFACSLLEMGIRPITDEHRWTVDQWMPDDSRGNRMGGFFGAYVVFHVVLLAWRALGERSRVAAVAGAGFAVLTAVVSVMPQSHELRYYLVWMLVLVGLNLWLACRPGVRGGGVAVGVVSLVALAVVASATRFAYVLPSGSRFEELVAKKVPAVVLAGVAEGERVCVRKEPWNMLWAAPFHAPRRYVVVEAE
jgi:hypothetical protein